jgi:hypothetical protein
MGAKRTRSVKKIRVLTPELKENNLKKKATRRHWQESRSKSRPLEDRGSLVIYFSSSEIK